MKFLSTPSARRATIQVTADIYTHLISIHALREEGDDGKVAEIMELFLFLSTPSARRATWPVSLICPVMLFLSTPSARRATDDALQFICTRSISIHALREEGDPWTAKSPIFWFKFLSTPSARRATRGRVVLRLHSSISIHALREEGDAFLEKKPKTPCYFYPRPPRGGRLRDLRLKHSIIGFLSTPSARRATAKTETKSLFSYKLYNILHEFRRALIYNGSKNYPNHAK